MVVLIIPYPINTLLWRPEIGAISRRTDSNRTTNTVIPNDDLSKLPQQTRIGVSEPLGAFIALLRSIGPNVGARATLQLGALLASIYSLGGTGNTKG